MKKVIYIFIFILLLAVPVLANSCEFAWKDEKIKNQTSTYITENNICQVVIKAATELFTFSTNECRDGYCAEGIGTTTATVYKDNPEVHDMSYVKYFIDDSPTDVTICNFKAENIFTRILNFLGL